ncbi:hypothetical protein NOI24_21320 [Neorhizobium galegae]|uniref:site-specific integrase n=1 Tax=Neorhizobium galegae TaxID=399 RepID=UPI0021027982|nr:site-specific integrase [Neorhizobium galegae]MCQ1773858.1 hypothetical protein [Neorhizobium galegae]MCQ1799675.1 hypothetical protein [Neorhizobium galegae]
MKKASIKYLFERNKTFYFRMSIPPAKRADFKKREFVESLGTRSLEEAITLLESKTQFYLAKLAGIEIDDSVAALRETTKALTGADYRPVAEVVSAPVEDSIEITGVLIEAFGKLEKPTRNEVAALGGVKQPAAITMREAWELFEKHSEVEWVGLNHREQQKIRNKFMNAVKEFETVMGEDVDILKLTKKDVFTYRTKLLERLAPNVAKNAAAKDDPEGTKKKPLKVDTIRKKLMWPRVIARHIYDLESLKDSPFENLRPIKGIGDEEKRPPLTEEEVMAVRKHYNEVHANNELVAIMAVIENTGASAKEIVLLDEADIDLESEIPHIAIQPNDHRAILKTDNRVRKVPLVGIALDAMKRFPQGFPRYRIDNGAENLSAAANKLIKPVAPGKTTYGYRHRLEDLMKAQGVEDTLRDSIKGHGSEGMSGYYGTEYPLHVKLEVLKKVLPAHAY